MMRYAVLMLLAVLPASMLAHHSTTLGGEFTQFQRGARDSFPKMEALFDGSHSAAVTGVSYYVESGTVTFLGSAAGHVVCYLDSAFVTVIPCLNAAVTVISDLFSAFVTVMCSVTSDLCAAVTDMCCYSAFGVMSFLSAAAVTVISYPYSAIVTVTPSAFVASVTVVSDLPAAVLSNVYSPAVTKSLSCLENP
eukprot:TRINITY_DN3501_c0_g1_i1.p1 TRINITY_DN3501_c0_g1~~TRINITY_DN3501_c0_g1_i1.p1  ORF type:complete len:210 (+),score=19.85 TRINITY_DN3501_c0_g1_i1:52-630(+)